MNQSLLLTAVTFLPLVGAVVVALSPVRWARILALGAALADALLVRGLVERLPGGRALRTTPSGSAWLNRLGVAL